MIMQFKKKKLQIAGNVTMIKCQACGTQNIDSSQYCDECGDSLNKYKAPERGSLKRRKSVRPDTQSPDFPVFRSASMTSVEIPPMVEDVSSSGLPLEQKAPGNSKSAIEGVGDVNSLGTHAHLLMERGVSVGTRFLLSSRESNIGRWDADNGVFPDVDLDSHDPEAKVSRKHARIIFKDNRHFLEDLGSTNGTFVNRGRRLIPGNPYPLKEGDEIIVGKTFLRFHISE